jgi:ribonuclease VapC
MAKIDEMISNLRIDVRGIDLNQGELARRAFLTYGKGKGRAGLNFGDCFSYALAKAREDTLLFKGDDFIHTDIVPAWRP